MDGGEPWQPPQQPFDLNSLQVAVVLPVGLWQNNLDFLRKYPWCDVDTLIRTIHQQVMAQVERRHKMSAEPPA
jgi:hypothetical protein